jgi:hypothetical protein
MYIGVMRPFLLALLLSAAACSSTVDTSNTGIPGDYQLVRIDGNPLPFKSGSTTTLRGSVSFTSNSRFTLAQTDSVAGSAAVETTLQGTWDVQENALVLHQADGKVVLGIAVQPDTVRVTVFPHDNTYARKK